MFTQCIAAGPFTAPIYIFLLTLLHCIIKILLRLIFYVVEWGCYFLSRTVFFSVITHRLGSTASFFLPCIFYLFSQFNFYFYLFAFTVCCVHIRYVSVFSCTCTFVWYVCMWHYMYVLRALYMFDVWCFCVTCLSPCSLMSWLVLTCCISASVGLVLVVCDTSTRNHTRHVRSEYIYSFSSRTIRVHVITLVLCGQSTCIPSRRVQYEYMYSFSSCTVRVHSFVLVSCGMSTCIRSRHVRSNDVYL